MLIAAISMLMSAASQELHIKTNGKHTVLEPSHYHTESSSASTREEDLAQHVQADPDEILATQLSQEAPHTQLNTVSHSNAAGETGFQKESTVKEHWGEKNETENASSGRSGHLEVNTIDRELPASIRR